MCKRELFGLINRQATGGLVVTSYVIVQFYFFLRACVLDGVGQYSHSYVFFAKVG